MFKRLATVVLTLFLWTGAHAQAPAWKKIRIGVEGSYPPFSMIASDGGLAGFDIDIARSLCARLKAECVLVQQQWDGMIPALKVRKFDAISPRPVPASRSRTTWSSR